MECEKQKYIPKTVEIFKTIALALHIIFLCGCHLSPQVPIWGLKLDTEGLMLHLRILEEEKSFKIM